MPIIPSILALAPAVAALLLTVPADGPQAHGIQAPTPSASHAQGPERPAVPPAREQPARAVAAVAIAPGTLFSTSDSCMACHNSLFSPSGQDVSIGFEWRSSMMANSSRDPYWHAGVRREVLDHPEAAAAIENECSACHMPMMQKEAVAGGAKGQVFHNLPAARGTAPTNVLAADGVSCTVCHQIGAEKLGTRESFNAGFVVAPPPTPAPRRIFGPYAVDAGRARIMRSASGFTPAEAEHVRSSEACATCHTLYTHALGAGGAVVGELPEQVPYLEWLHSGYRKQKSCSDCHMPLVEQETAITSVLGQPRPHFSRHEFRGGNFFMPRMLNRYRIELAVAALPQELDATAGRSVDYLERSAASLSIARSEVRDGRLSAEVVVDNHAGHKLPTAYPSRRAWLHVAVRDRDGRVVFESGAFSPDGRVQGNDNDADAARFEPHYVEITRADQVQVYETIMADQAGQVTTGLLSGVRYVKDNRVLPAGFDKATADKDVAVYGEAAQDPDFAGGADRVRYLVDVGNAAGPLKVDAELCYQSIGFRWAANLEGRKAPEPERFVRYYRSMAAGSRAVLAKASVTVQ